MPVIYGNQSIRPGPDVVIEKRFTEFGDGRKAGVVITATLRGTITTTKTDDTISAIPLDSRLTTTLQKQQELRNIFAVDGQYFEIQGWDGSQSTKFLATVKSVEFDEGLWIDVCPYTVILEGFEFSGEGTSSEYYIDSATESWSFEDGDTPHTYRVNHSMTAKGKTVYETDGTLQTFAWQRAKSFVSSNLTLGWVDSNTNISPLSGEQIWQSSENYDSTATNVYNRILQESQDELEGTYSLVESFILGNNNYLETSSVSVRRTTDDPLTTCVVSISGTITGLFVNLHDYESKLANAQSRWEQVQPLLYSMAVALAPSNVTLDTRPLQGTFDVDKNNGVITYNYEFSDRRLINDTYETYTIDKKTAYQAPFITVTISGTIQGVLYLGETDISLKYTRALAQWNIVKLQIYARCLAVNSYLTAYPINDSVTLDQIGGSVSYSFEFDNRPYMDVIDDFTVSKNYTRESGRTEITVSGTITGLYTTIQDGEPSPTSYLERFNNAVNYWNTINGNLLGRVSVVGISYTEINPTAYSQQYSYNQYEGTVNYTYTWNNIPAPCVPGSLSEIITVSDDFALPVVASIGVIGNGSVGPVIQDLNAVTEMRRSVTFEIVMPVSYTDTTSLICSNKFLPPVIDYSSYMPIGNVVKIVQNQQTWSPSNGRLVRQLAWIYT